ncbi:MAG: hypothetical protein A2991_02070 [Candidatus Terrybacteria bacterium RIFCSPLOWO2_01_FULL_58_14]|uniref:Isopropylmalate dehydrogenase-like domain-containing protein n=2 Tax=Candidatus Terryibacteriota TaxID=1817920 RepID=A0A1G2PXZ7_9BACT|nr:MAG: hypothetical protein A2682_02670 [Candidatus Terrybacteria bacterium RIFCSPHIGHO2_01_FULL_58_15]OHA53173.1 MAG: hypothetical protein A2991_02070 [Candidatus Terrybacteria bacterium RIFCSPLOWO2_01_FULL_58_14]
MRDVILIRGDGIGPEIAAATIAVLRAARAPLRFREYFAGRAALARGLDPLPSVTLRAIRKHRLALKGPLETPVGEGYRSANVALRQSLGLYANVRPVRAIPGIATFFPRVDLVIIRENTEDLYTGIEIPRTNNRAIRALVRKGTGRTLRSDAAVALKIITKSASRKVAAFTLSWAKRNRRHSVSIVHKANILKETDGLFLREARAIFARQRAIRCDDLIVDNAAQQLVRKPERLDVLLCPNLYGDILSDLAAGLIGGIGLAPSAQIGDRAAVFEPVHGTAPDIAGKGIANPTAMIFSAVMLLRHLGDRRRANHIERAVENALLQQRFRTRDLGGSATTRHFTEGVLRNLAHS